MSSVKVVEAQTGKAWKDFLNVPFLVQGKNEHWVPPLRIQQKELLDTKKNPFYQNADRRCFVAYLDGKPVGRIAAIKDNRHNEYHSENTCHFGHFDVIDNAEVAEALFKAAEDAGREWGFDLIRGPFNPNINEDMGIQMDAYDTPPYIMMPYNPAYYPTLIEGLDYRKSMDVYCYMIEQEDMSAKLKRGAEVIRKRSHLNFRKLNMKQFWRDARLVWQVHMKAWEKNWGAVPFTEEEFHHLAKNLKTAVDPDQVFFAEDPDTGETVGFSLALPNINEAIIKIRDGRLFPFGLLKLLWLTRPGKLQSSRVIVMGVIEEYRNRGIDALFYYDHFIEGQKKGIQRGEMSWILETNTMMNRAAEMMGGKRYKTYRIYEKPLGGPWE
ncbi:N-acetyltransferase [bacterium]|nr:N-acetyltransferase [bacterium]